MKVPAFAAPRPGAPLAPWTVDRRDPSPREVAIDILFCGICHSDIHQVRDEWGAGLFPMVPGHEIVGRVAETGREVTRFRTGDVAGVGCMVDSCGVCPPCRRGHEQFCEKGVAFTYNSTEMDRKARTYGGYSTRIVVPETFALKIPSGLDLAAATPLLCAGITTYSPLRRWKVKAGDRVGVVGLGGLGHMAVKLAASMGAEVTMLSTSASKETDARRLGARGFANSREASTFQTLKGSFDFLLDTISAPHDYNAYLGLVRAEGTMVIVGVPPEPVPLQPFSLIGGNRVLAGSIIGGIPETQEMLDYCGKHGIVSEIETIPVQKVNEAYERMLKNDVRYRFVIDAASLKA
jgi:alcohol dehydrogenase (NADP+)